MLINGQAQDHLPVSDRALHYGDGVFETIRVREHEPLLWDQHLARLMASCARLRIPLAPDLLMEDVRHVLSTGPAAGILKIIVSRGSGGRGYTPPDHPTATRIVQLHPLPAEYDVKAATGINAMICRHPLSSNSALAGMKHLNRIDQVIASMELTEHIDEGLMCNESGDVIEGIKSNVFLVIAGQVITPDLTYCGVAGIMRATVLDLFSKMTMNVSVRDVPVAELRRASEVFVCNSVLGIWPVTHIRLTDCEWRSTSDRITRAVQSLLRNVF